MQQINLYHAKLRKKEQLVSFDNVAKASISLLLILTLVQVYSFYQTSSLKNQLRQNTLLLSQKKVRLQTLQNSLPKIEKDLSLKDTLTQLEHDLISKKKVLTILSDKKLGNTNGFSKQFVGLARQTLDGLWLTKLHFYQGGTILNLEGKSQTPVLVPKYLQSLSNEDIFNGTEFTSFIIHQPEDENTLIFKLNNQLKNSSNNIELTSR